MSEETKDTTTEPESTESGIEVHNLESDMKLIGVGEQEQESIEAKPDEGEQQKEEVEQTKKPSRSERRIKRLADRNRELEEQLQEARGAKSTTKAEPADEPDLNDYDTYEEYDEAKIAYEASKSSPETKEQTEPEQKRDEREIVLFEDGQDQYDDFDEVVTNKDLVLSQDLYKELLESDMSADVAYFLGSNPDESKRISGLSKRAMQREVIKIEAKLDGKPVKKQKKSTKAPEPISPVSGASADSKSLGDDNLSFQEHEALLNSRKKASAGGFI